MSIAVCTQIASPIQEPAPICYVCYEEGTAENDLLDPNPCSCKGSIHIHRLCLIELMKTSNTCSICKTRYVNPEFAGYTCRMIPYSDSRTEIYRQLYEFYKTDEEGRLHGTYKLAAFFNYRNGTSKHFLIEESNYKHGALHGLSRHWDYDAHYCTPGGHYPKYELTYVDGVVDGPFKEYEYRSSLIKKVGTFKRGAEVKVTNYGLRYPTIALIGDYKHYTYFSQHSYGKQLLVEHIIYNEDGTIADGPQHEEYCVDGCIVGFIASTYKGGQLDGPWNAYNYNGDLLESVTYRAGKKEGEYISYYTMTTSSAHFKLGQQVGIKMRANYKGGQLNGLCQTYDWPVNGKSHLSATEIYRNGVQIGKQCLYSHGRLTEVTTLKKDGSRILHGPAWFYNEKDGSLVQKCNYNEGQLDGLLRIYNDNGICAQSILMHEGAPKEGSSVRVYNEETGVPVKNILVEYGASLEDLITNYNVHN